MSLCPDVLVYITNFVPDNFKTFRLVSKQFSEITLRSINLAFNEMIWLCKVYIINKRELSAIKKQVIPIKNKLLI